MGSNKRFLSISLKLVVSVSLLIYVLAKVDITLIWSSIRKASLVWLAFALSLHFVGLFLSACRWRLLLNAQGIDASLRALSSSYMVGFFFNTFLPTTVGGDITRAYDVSRRGHLMGGKSPTRNRAPREARTEKSIAVIIVERSGGVASLLFLAIVASLFGGSIFARLPSFWLTFCLLLFLLCFAIAVLNPSVSGWLGRIFKIPPSPPEAIRSRPVPSPPYSKIQRKVSAGVSHFGSRVLAILEAISVYKSKRKSFFMALAFSLGLQINTVIHCYLIARGLGIDVPVVYFFMIVPLVILVLLLPISINGIGVRENAYGFFLGQLGVGMTVSIALAWISFALVLIFAVAGGIIYILRK